MTNHARRSDNPIYDAIATDLGFTPTAPSPAVAAAPRSQLDQLFAVLPDEQP